MEEGNQPGKARPTAHPRITISRAQHARARRGFDRSVTHGALGHAARRENVRYMAYAYGEGCVTRANPRFDFTL